MHILTHADALYILCVHYAYANTFKRVIINVTVKQIRWSTSTPKSCYRYWAVSLQPPSFPLQCLRLWLRKGICAARIYFYLRCRLWEKFVRRHRLAQRACGAQSSSRVELCGLCGQSGSSCVTVYVCWNTHPSLRSWDGETKGERGAVGKGKVKQRRSEDEFQEADQSYKSGGFNIYCFTNLHSEHWRVFL